MGLFDSITPGVASAFGALTTYLGGQQTNQANLDVANANNAWSAEQYATRYQTQVKDLEAAGLNPMLAYMQSPGSAPTAQPVQLQNSAGEAVRAYNEGYSSRTRGEHDIASAGVARKMQAQIDAATEKIYAEIVNIPKEGKRLDRLAEMLYQQGNLYFQQQTTEAQKADWYRAVINNLKREGKILDADYDAMVKTGFIGRLAREVKPISDMGTDWLDSIKPWSSKHEKGNGTYYDRNGNPSGGYSYERSTK